MFKSKPNAFTHAAEVSQWISMLLGWIWLGEQGMLLGWPIASGLLPVALWWAVRLLCRGSAWIFRCTSLVFALFGLLTALGVWLVGQQASSSFAHAGLLTLAVVWGAWNALIETRTQSSTFQLGSLAWHPLVAAALVLAGWQMPDTASVPHLGVIALLVMSTGFLFAHDRYNAERKQTCLGVKPRIQNLLPPSAMGLMMGSLWLSDAWCVGLGWRTEQMAVMHLGLMAGLPALVSSVVRSPKLQPFAKLNPSHVSLTLLTLGAIALMGDGPFFSVLAMLLPSLAWAVHCTRSRLKNERGEIASPWLVKGLSLLLGPLLLAWVGVLSPAQGPLATQTALAILGVLAFLQLLHFALVTTSLRIAGDHSR